MSGNYPPQGPGYSGPPQGPSFGPGGFEEPPAQPSGNVPPPGPGQYGQPPQGGQYGQPGQGGQPGQYGQPGGIPSAPGTPSGPNPYMTYTGPESSASANPPPYSPSTYAATPPPKKSNTGMIAIICSVAAVVVIGAIILGVVLTRGSSKTASDAVQGYFDAIIANDATTALSYAKVEPTDKTFLTNEVLTASNAAAPITNVKVAKTNERSTYQVAVSYTIGEQNVNVEIDVEKVGNEWKLDSVATPVDLSRLKVKPTINGVKATTDKIFLFIGSYTFATGNKYVDFVDGKNVVRITEPQEYGGSSVSSDLELQLLADGKALMLQKAQESLNACMAKRELKPEGCPFYANPNTTGTTVHMETLKYTAEGEQFADAKPRLEYDNPLVAQFSYYPKIRYYLEGTKNGTRGKWDFRVTSSDTNTAQMDFSTEEPTFSWVA